MSIFISHLRLNANFSVVSGNEMSYPELFGMVARGEVDVMPDTWGVSYQRMKVEKIFLRLISLFLPPFQHVDFSYALEWVKMYIYSGRPGEAKVGASFSDIFDSTSYALFFVALLSMMLAKWLIMPDKSLERYKLYRWGI